MQSSDINVLSESIFSSANYRCVLFQEQRNCQNVCSPTASTKRRRRIDSERPSSLYSIQHCEVLEISSDARKQDDMVTSMYNM